MPDVSQANESQRIDKWLWFARFRKTRGLAQDLCTGGHVTLNGATVAKPSTTVRPGDELELILGPFRRRLRVVALGVRRGPAPEAQALYEETVPPERLHDPVMAPTPAVRDAGSGRPTKRDRRVMDRFRGHDLGD